MNEDLNLSANVRQPTFVGKLNLMLELKMTLMSLLYLMEADHSFLLSKAGLASPELDTAQPQLVLLIPVSSSNNLSV